jgi:hypothetical protein
MAKARNPKTVSGAFSVSKSRLAQLGVLDATLALDTKLFIDPLLLSSSAHPEMKVGAVQLYRERFETIIKLLRKRRSDSDPAWTAALRLFDFPEISGTGLGYGAGSTHGSGWGPKTRRRVLGVAAQIVDIGVDDPDLFSALALFEENIGSDLMSDMTTNIIMGSLAAFNSRILTALGLSGEDFEVQGVKGQFLVNPTESERSPVILVPTDVLRDLPVAEDWDGVAEAARKNADLRNRVNQNIAEIWAKKTKRDKVRLKKQLLKNKEAFETLLKAIRRSSAKPYDVESDPEGLVRWAVQAHEYAQQNPINLKRLPASSLDDVLRIVLEIIKQFRHLIENAGLNKELFQPNKKPRHESTAQRLFFAVAYSYCEANNVDISPEIDTGNGNVDFKFSVGFQARVLVEVKLSRNPGVVAGYRNQLEIYKRSQQTMKAVYLLIDVGNMGRKENELELVRQAALKKGAPLSELEVIDGTLKPSASKRH